ncbi:ABC transporter, ATP-binding protein [Vulgatibacter incomptus]|uniref:ABC transporter, ATP-binding protein n=1 Tax=Vulgatibacter incomptus TaxID=1391653 RepID=A0A0K1PEU3_9BACT|nr:ATP-binding cassette domain-containing protein [Vulgatibacter incomptus]AKU92053.1 ABC transporter, ATP-binding protein [Vulgatibacter incomptus]
MISVRNLVKHYKVHSRPPGLAAAVRSVFRRSFQTVRAVDGISFEIQPGERVGFLGPNGAGKTTTLKMLSGLLRPTSGEARVAGFRPDARERDFLRSIMLVTGQKQQLLWDLPPAETFELNRAVYDVPRAEYRQTLDELVNLLDLSELIGKPTRQLSLGERMKCELAAALLHRPKVLFLDEPTIGLDVTMQAAVRSFIQSYNERTGATVILTSHYMDDVAALCPRVIVIDRGDLSFDGSLDALVRQIQPEKRVILRLSQPVERLAVERLGGRVISLSDAEAKLQVDGSRLRELVAAALAHLPIADLTVEDAPLEEVLAGLFARGRDRGRESAVAR